MNKRSMYLLTVVSTALYAQDTIKEPATELTPLTVIEQQEKALELEVALKSQPRDISELLNKDSRFDIAGGAANAKRFYIRGISEALTSITIDGAKQGKDFHQHRGGLGNIDTELLKSVRINPGVAPADSGPGTLGGSVKFETVDAQDLLKEGKNVGAFIKTSSTSIDDGYKNSLALYGKYNNIGLLVYGTKGDADDYKTGSGRTVLGSASEVDNYMAKISLLDLHDHDLKVSYEENTQEGLYQAGGAGSDMGYHDPDGTRELERQRVERETTILNHSYNPSSPYINTGLKLYKNDTTLSYLDDDDSDPIESEGSGADLRNSFEFKTKSFVNSLTLGVDYEEEEGKSESGDVKYDNTGIFIQNRMAFNRFNLSFGGRYDDFESDLIHRTSKGDEFSFNLNGDYSLTDNFTLFAGYGEAVSGSNTIPIGWLTSLDPNLTFNGSSTDDLDPQKAKKFEIGTNWKSNALFTQDDTFGFKVTLFKTDIEDPIVVGTGGRRGAPVSDIINDEDIETQGIEISSSYVLDSFKTMLSYSHTEVEQDGEDLEGTTKRQAGSYGDKIVADFTYTPTDRLMFGYTITGVLENNDAPEDVNNKAGYAVHDISASYIPQEFKDMTFTIAVNNLFDKEYAAHTSLSSGGEAVAEAGRDVRVSLKYQF